MSSYQGQRGSGEELPEWDGKQVKIPKSFSNRWTWASPSGGDEIGAFSPPNYEYDFEEVEDQGAKSIVHPLTSSLFESVRWHDRLEVVDYSYSNSRQYSAAGDVEISYMDEHQRSIGFGQKFDTEGFSFSLDQGTSTNTVVESRRK